MFCTPFTPDVVAANCTCHPAYELTHELGLPETCAAVLGTRDARLYLNLVIASILFVSTLVLIWKEIPLWRFSRLCCRLVLKNKRIKLTKKDYEKVDESGEIDPSAAAYPARTMVVFVVGLVIITQIFVETLLSLFVRDSEAIIGLFSTVFFFAQLTVEGSLAQIMQKFSATSRGGLTGIRSDLWIIPLFVVKGTILVFTLITFVGLMVQVIDLVSGDLSTRVATAYVVYGTLCGMASVLTLFPIISARPGVIYLSAAVNTSSETRELYSTFQNLFHSMILRLFVLVVMAISLALGPMTNGVSFIVVHFSWFMSLAIFSVFLINFSLSSIKGIFYPIKQGN